MALTNLSRRKPGEQLERQPRRGRQVPPRSGKDLEGLPIGTLYDMALHGAQFKGSGALLGAAQDVTAKNAMDVRRLVQPWQARSMSYFDLAPEVKFAARFNGNLLRRVRLFPAVLDDKTQEPEELTAGPVFDAFQRIKDRSGGMADLQGTYGTLKFLIGETYLTVSPDRERGEVWECLSPNELRVQPGGIATRFRAPMLSGDQYLIDPIAPEKYVVGNDKATVAQYGEVLEPMFGPEAEAIYGPAFSATGPDIITVWRLWRPHPAYTWLADSNMMASLDLLEELVLSTYSVRAQLKSRLNQSGILAMPEEMSFPSLGNNPDDDPNADTFQERFTQIIMQAIGDPGSSAAFSPIIVQMAGEFIKDIKLIPFNDSHGELVEISQRAEMIERFGVGAELPPELFKSQADLNHWTGWLIDKQTWDSYGYPAALEMATDLCAAYLQPAFYEDPSVDWTKICIGIDPSEAINHPNRSKDALDLFDRLLINGEVAREALGYNENDGMSQAEKDEQAGLKIKDGSLYRFGIPSVRANIEPEAGEVEGAPDTGAPGTPGVEPPPGGKAPGPPAQKTIPPASTKQPNAGPGATNAGPAITASAERQVRLLALAEAAVHRGRELAGSRLLSMTTGRNAGKCPDCQAALEGAAKWNVPCTLGEEQVVGLFGVEQPALLVDGTGAWLASMLEQQGVSAKWAADIGALAEQHCAGTLFQPQPAPFPAGFLRLLASAERPLEQA